MPRAEEAKFRARFPPLAAKGPERVSNANSRSCRLGSVHSKYSEANKQVAPESVPSCLGNLPPVSATCF